MAKAELSKEAVSGVTDLVFSKAKEWGLAIGTLGLGLAPARFGLETGYKFVGEVLPLNQAVDLLHQTQGVAQYAPEFVAWSATAFVGWQFKSRLIDGVIGYFAPHAKQAEA